MCLEVSELHGQQPALLFDLSLISIAFHWLNGRRVTLSNNKGQEAQNSLECFSISKVDINVQKSQRNKKLYNLTQFSLGLFYEKDVNHRRFLKFKELYGENN